MAGPKKKNRSVVGLFYGFSVARIMEWCGVSRQTASNYRTGRRQPSRQAAKLFALFAHNKVLGPEWDGFQVVGDRIYFPDGRWISRGELMGYEYVHQLAQLANRPEYERVASDMLKARMASAKRAR